MIGVIRRFVNLGGNWDNGSKSGSRYANTNTADNSNTNIGGRGVCGDQVYRSANAPCPAGRLREVVSSVILLRRTHYEVRQNVEYGPPKHGAGTLHG